MTVNEAIIDEMSFERAQVLLADRRPFQAQKSSHGTYALRHLWSVLFFQRVVFQT